MHANHLQHDKVNEGSSYNQPDQQRKIKGNQAQILRSYLDLHFSLLPKPITVNNDTNAN